METMLGGPGARMLDTLDTTATPGSQVPLPWGKPDRKVQAEALCLARALADRKPEPGLLDQIDPQRAQRAALRRFLTRLVIKAAGPSAAMRPALQDAWYCSEVLAPVQGRLQGMRCRRYRVCLTCSSLRTAAVLKAYGHLLQGEGLYMLTLTVPNVRAQDLAGVLWSFGKTWRACIHAVRRYDKIKPSGLRKTEVTYNAERGDYHPHIHAIVDSRAGAEALLERWLVACPGAERWCQDVRPAGPGAAMELCKYLLKWQSTGKGRKVDARAWLTMQEAMIGVRMFQPFGIWHKVKDQEVLEDNALPMGPLENWYWSDQVADWKSISGALLAGGLLTARGKGKDKAPRRVTKQEVESWVK